jgi:BT1 family protein
MKIVKALYRKFALPIKLIKKKYIPQLMIYCAAGFSSIYAISMTFWQKQELDLSAEELITISTWAMFPWTAKIIIGQLQDSVPIFGSLRKSYIYIGAALTSAGSLILVGLGNNASILNDFSIYSLLIISVVLIATGIVLQDMVADVLAVEVVETINQDGSKRPDIEIKEEMAIIQVLQRMALSLAAFIAAGIGGYLAYNYSFAQISYTSLIIPLMSISGGLLIRVQEPKSQQLNRNIFLGSIIYVITSVVLAFVGWVYSQEIAFFFAAILATILLYILIRDQGKEVIKTIFAIFTVLFVYRLTPTFGPGVEWWTIDVLEFTPDFFGTLSQVNYALSLFGIWFFMRWLIKTNVAKILLAITLIEVTLQLPIVGMAFGFHEWTMEHLGFGARTIALVDTVATGPFSLLSMVPLGVVCAFYAPKQNRATWFAITASISNLALVGGGIVTKILSKIYVIERGSYENVQGMMVSSLLLQLLIPLTAILFFWKVLNMEK